MNEAVKIYFDSIPEERKGVGVNAILSDHCLESRKLSRRA